MSLPDVGRRAREGGRAADGEGTPAGRGGRVPAPGEARRERIERLAAIGQIGAGLAHELNQPLTALAIYAEGCQTLVRGNPIALDELYEAAEKIQDSALRAGRTLQRLQELAQRREPRRALVRVPVLVDDALRAWRRRLLIDAVEIDARHAAPDASLVCDGLAIQQAVLELLANAHAALARHEGPRRLAVTTARAAGACRIEVADSGPGLPASVVEAVERARGPCGGLAVVRDVVRAHGGDWTFDAPPGGGCRVRLELPEPSPEDPDPRR